MFMPSTAALFRLIDASKARVRGPVGRNWQIPNRQQQQFAGSPSARFEDTGKWMPIRCSLCLVSWERAFSLPSSEQCSGQAGRYEQLAKPSWRPPNRLFAPVWTVLYITIAVSGWLVWREAGFAGATVPLTIYAVQLVLNAAWTPLFFGLHRPDFGLFDIVLLWLTIIATVVLFYPIHVGAAWLLLPYLAWVTFAAALNFTVWRLNRSMARS